MNTSAKGARFEREVKHLFESQGWHCIRSASSRFPDVVCFRNGKVVVIECKSKWEEHVDELRKISKKTMKMGVPVFLVYRNKPGYSAIKIEPDGWKTVPFEKLLKGTQTSLYLIVPVMKWNLEDVRDQIVIEEDWKRRMPT